MRIGTQIKDIIGECEGYSEEPGPQKLGMSMKLHLNGKDLVAKLLVCVDREAQQEGERAALYKMIPEELLQNGYIPKPEPPLRNPSRCVILCE